MQIINTISYTSTISDSEGRPVREERSTKIVTDRKLTKAAAQKRIRKTTDSTAVVTSVEAATAA